MKVNILGFGTMGRQVAALMELLGYSVTVWTRSPSVEREKRYVTERRVLFKRFEAADRPVSLDIVERLTELSSALTIETLVEDLDVKHSVLGQLPYDLSSTELFSNSSSLAPHEISPEAEALHFFNPLYSLRLVEVTKEASELGKEGSCLLNDIARLGFSIVRTESNRGYIGNFVLFQEIGAALKLVDQYGYSSKAIDTVLKGIGRSTSLFDVIDFVGVDVVKSILQHLQEVDSHIYVSPLLANAIDRGILGRKNKTSIRTLIDERV